MIVKIKGNKLIQMGEYCEPMWKEKYLPRYINGVMPDGKPNDEQVLVGYEQNKKCLYCDDCKDCYQVILPVDYSGNLEDYNFEVSGRNIILMDFTIEAKNRQLANKIFAKQQELAKTDYIFTKKSEYEIVGKPIEQYDYSALHAQRELLRADINSFKTQLEALNGSRA